MKNLAGTFKECTRFTIAMETMEHDRAPWKSHEPTWKSSSISDLGSISLVAHSFQAAVVYSFESGSCHEIGTAHLRFNSSTCFD